MEYNQEDILTALRKRTGNLGITEKSGIDIRRLMIILETIEDLKENKTDKIENTIDYSKKEVNNILIDIENRIKLCLKSTKKDKEKGMPPEMDWKAEALGYKTSLECVKGTREKFGLKRKEESEK